MIPSMVATRSPSVCNLSPSVCNLPLIESKIGTSAPSMTPSDARPDGKDRNQLATHLDSVSTASIIVNWLQSTGSRPLTS